MNRKSQSVGELDINGLLYTALQKRLTSLEKQLLYTRVLFLTTSFHFLSLQSISFPCLL